jgi:hypothetical protein
MPDDEIPREFGGDEYAWSFWKECRACPRCREMQGPHMLMCRLHWHWLLVRGPRDQRLDS